MPRRIVPNMSTPIVSSFEVDEKASDSKDRSFGSVLKRFATVTTAHGPFHIAISENVFSKIFWTVMLIFAAGILTWQTYELIADYNSYNTASELIHSDRIPFPAVTICNVNRMKRSLLVTILHVFFFFFESCSISSIPPQLRNHLSPSVSSV